MFICGKTRQAVGEYDLALMALMAFKSIIIIDNVRPLVRGGIANIGDRIVAGRNHARICITIIIIGRKRV